jgi:hypothetical protein
MQGSESYRLIVRRGPQPNQVYELTDEVVNLGRDITNNIVINDREVSRHHLRFTRGAEGFTMEDLGSTNGTFINGRRVTGASLLKPGDMIGLGETVTLSYDIARGGVPAAPPSAQPPAAAPYQPPAAQQPAASPYQPPAQQQPPAASPYQPPAQQQPPAYQQPPADPYAQSYQQPQQQPAGQQYPAPGYQQQPQQDPYAQQQGAYADPYAQQAYSPPPPPGYGYDQHDPFGMREEEGTSTTRIILIGCGVLMLLCCCCTLVGVVLVDQLCLYDKIPFLSDILRALGIVIKC